jgi:hypothetical protein
MKNSATIDWLINRLEWHKRSLKMDIDKFEEKQKPLSDEHKFEHAILKSKFNYIRDLLGEVKHRLEIEQESEY